ncbi:MAG: MFS transporter [Dehalococcoidia bacterium]
MVSGAEVGSLVSEPTAIDAAPVAAGGIPPFRIPALIRRNTFLLTAAEAFVGTGQQMVPTLGAIMVVRLIGSVALAGLGSSVLGLMRVLVSYPSGRLADGRGRKPILVLGLVLSLIGAVALGLSVVWRSFPFFVAALVLFGVGNGASQQQRRLAAADLYPPQHRGRGLGVVLTGAVIGAFGGPLLISAAGRWATPLHIDQVALSWFLVPAVLLPSLILVLLIHPDPQEIAASLERFYPDYQPPAPAARAASSAALADVGLRTFLRTYPHFVALVCMFVLFGNMSMMMALTPITMSMEGMSLAAISLTVSIHVAGMYAFSFPLGMLADALGRRPVLFGGVILSTLGTVLVAMSTVYPLIVLGLFFIGVGWCCGNVATAALVADTSPPEVRGRAMGANSSLSAAASVAAPLLGGVLLRAFGPHALVVMTVLFMLPCLGLLLGLRETSPGMYAHRGLLEPA